MVCKSVEPADSINPLNLKYQRSSSVVLPSAAAPPATQSRSTSPNSYYSRQRRHTDESNAGSPQALVQTNKFGGDGATPTSVDDAIAQDSNICGPNKCTRFECNVYELGHNEIATIYIRSRLYEDTVKAMSLKEFDISSVLFAQVKSLPYNVSSLSEPPKRFLVKTQVHTTGIAVQDLLPWWLVLLAILLGIALFVLLACFLRYLGFFARKRPPQTAATTGAGAEREPLTPSMWNDYHYTPGDTAL